MALRVAELEVVVDADTSALDSKLSKTSSTLDSYGSKINGATSTAKDFNSATSTMGAGVSSADAALGSFGSTASNSQANFDALTEATNQQTDALKGLSLQAKGLGFMEAGEQISSMTAGLREFATSGVDAASDLNESQSAVNTVYGESAHIINDFAESAAQNLGMTENQALSTSAQLGAMFTSMGLGTAQTADFSTGILQAATDLGSFHNAMPIDVVNALRAGLVGEAEPLRRFGILLSADAVEAKALEMGLADAHGEISEGAKVQARYALIMDQVGAAQGDFARTSEGLANAQRINQAAMADLRAEMGQQLLPIQLEMTKVQGKLIGALADMPPHLQQIAAVGMLAVGSLGPMLQTMGQLMIVAPQLGSALAAMTGPIGLIAIGLAALGIAAYTQNWFGFRDAVDSVVGSITAFASQFGQIFDMFSNGSDAASGLTQRIEGFGKAVEFTTGLPVADFFSGIASALDEAGNHFASIQERISELMGAGFTPLQAVVRALREEFPKFSGAIAAAGTVVQNFFDTVQGIASGLGDALNALRNGDWGGVFQGLLAAGQAAVGGLINHFSILGGALLQAFNAIDWPAIGATLYAGIQSVSTGLQTWFQEQSDKLAATLSGAWTAISAGIAPAWQGITAAISSAWGVIQTAVSTAVETLKTNVGTAWTAIASSVAPAWAIVTAAISGAWATIQTTIGTALTTLQTTIGTAFTGLGPTITTAMETVKTAATTAWETIKTDTATKIEEIKTSVGTAFGTFGETISTGMAAAQTAAATVWDAIKTDATTKIEAMKGEVLGKWDTLRTEIVNKVTDLQTTLASTFDGLKVDIPAKMTELATNAIASIDTLKTDIVAKVNELQTSVTDAVETLKTDALDKFEELSTNAQTAIQTLSDEAIATFGTLTTDAVAKVEELKTSAVESFTSLQTEAVQLVTDLTTQALAQFDVLKADVQTKADEIKTGFITTLDAMKTDAVAKVGEIKDGIIGVFDGAIGWLEQVGKDLIQGLINGIESMKDAAWNKMTELVSGIKQIPGAEWFIKSPSKLFYQYGVWLIEGLINGFEKMEGEAYAAMRRIAENISGRFADGIRKAKPEAVAAAKDLGDSIAQTVQSRLDAIFDLVGLSSSSKVKEGSKKAGKSIGDSVNDGLESKKADHQKKMTEFLDAGVDYGLDKARDAEDIGVMAANAIRDGLTSSQQTLVTTAGKIATQVVDEFGDRVQAMYDVGKNFGEGFVLGLESMADEAAAAANALGKSAEKELRKATESQSPSKAAHRVGADVAQGFADGISSGEEEVGRAADRLWKRAWQKLKNRIKDFGFLGREWAVDFWQGMLDAPDMTGPLAAWITDQMVAAAKTALQKIQAQLAGIAAQLDIARNLPDPDTTIPQVPQPEPVDTTQRDLLQAQLDATKELTAALEKAFTSAFDAAHKAHVAFVKGQISESEYQAKLQIAQNAYAQKQMNAAQVASLEAQVKAAQDAIDKETAARQKAYEEAVKAREAQVEAERQAQAAQVKQLEQAQRDAQMEMTQTVIDEANKRISQYEKELKKATDPKEKAELKAKIALEKERITVANQLAGAITAANNATNDFDLSVANAQIDYFTAQLEALGQVDVGGMLQGIADAMLEAANKIAQAADKMKNAFRGGGKGKGEKDKGGATQDASDPSLGGGGMGAAADGGGVSQEFDKIGKAARKAGDDVNAGMGVADMAIRKVLGTTLPAYVKGMGDAGTKGGEALGKNASVAIEHGEASMSKTIVKSVEGATLNGVKIGADRGKEIGVTVTTNMETGVKSREREVTKTVDGVVKDSTDAAVPTAEKGGTKIGDGFITFTSRSITQGQSKVAGDAKQMMTQAGQQAQQEAQRTGKSAGSDFSKYTAQGVKQGERDVRRAGKDIMDGAGQEAKRDANRLGRQAGDDLGRGVAEGIRGRINDVRQAAKDLADAANSGGGGGGGGNGGGGGGGGGNGGGGGGGGHRRDAVVEAQQLGTRVGDAMATGVADGVRAQTRTAEQAAVDLVQATNQAARKAAQAHSPSKLFMRLGNDIGDGLVIGLHDRKGDAQDAAQALIYTPKGLPGGRSGNSTGSGGDGHGGAPVIVREYHFHGDIHVPNARVFEDIVDRKTRMNNVAASRGQ